MKPSRIHQRGSVLIYSFFAIMVLLAFAVLSVDFGRVQLAKSELQAATDAAVRAAGQRMLDGGTPGEILASAVGAAGNNKIDGRSVTVRWSNLQFGVWDAAGRRFIFTNDPTMANAVRIELSHTFGVDSDGLHFAPLLGERTRTIHHRATVLIGDVPAGFDAKTFTQMNPGSSGSTPDTVITEETVTEYYRQQREARELAIRVEQERVRKIEEEKRRVEEDRRREEERRRIAERDARERANPQLKIDRLAREERERRAWEIRERERRESEERARIEQRNTTVIPGTQWNNPGSTTTTTSQTPTPPPPKRILQVE
jgi:hypothetical protein